MKKQVVLILLCALVLSRANAQSNIVADAGLTRIAPNIFSEKGNYYYCVSVTQRGPQNQYIPSVKAKQFEVVKIHKFTHQKVGSVIVYGDTLQADSTVLPQENYMVLKNDRLHLVFNSVYYPSAPPTSGVIRTRYVQVDTNLNILIPQKPVSIPTYIQSVSTYNGDSILITYWNYGTSGFDYSRYTILDGQGNWVKDDTLEVKPIPASNAPHQVVDVLPYPGNRYLVTGFVLPAYKRGFYIADNNLQLLDTFYLKPDSIPHNGGIGVVAHFPHMVSLPTGSIISAGNYIYQHPSQPVARFSLLAKHEAHSRFNTDVVNIYGKANPSDVAHTIAPGEHNVEYNIADNYLYFADVTNKSPNFFSCDIDYDIIEIVSADTNLNTRWHKYIQSGPDSCVWISRISVPDNRPGILVTGYTMKSSDPTDTNHFRSFAFYIDSSGAPLSVPGSTAVKLRNRIEIYPNPTKGRVQVNDIYRSDAEVLVYDLSGRILQKYRVGKHSTSVDISQHSPGIYLLKVVTIDGVIEMFKVIKE